MHTLSRTIRCRLTYANVMSTIAVLAALGGSAYAAATVGSGQVVNNSLTGLDLKNNSVASADVTNNSLTTVDVRDRSLLAKDFKAGQLPTGATGPAGAPGVKGDKGDTGAKGDKGDPSFTRTIVVSPGATAAESGDRLRAALAQAGTIATSANYDILEQVIVQLEGGTYAVSSKLTVPLHVGITGAGSDATTITTASGAFPDAALMDLPGSGDGGNHGLSGLRLTTGGTQPSGFAMVKIGGEAFVIADDLDINVFGSATPMRGVLASGSFAGITMRDSRISLVFGTDSTGIEVAGGATALIDSSVLIANGDAASTPIDLVSGNVELTRSRVNGGNHAVDVAASGSFLSFDSYLTGGGAGVKSLGTAKLIRGALTSGSAPNALAANIECLDVLKGTGDAAVMRTAGVCG